LIRSFTPAVVSTVRSKAAPFSIWAFNGTAAPQVKTSLCPVDFSNPGASCSSVVFRALELITLISAAPAQLPAASIMANPTAAAAIVCCFMAFPPERIRARFAARCGHRG